MQQVIKSTQIDKEDLTLINKYSKRELSQDEVFAFSLNLCDNDIDRDFEAFDENALEVLSQMFIGVTGIFDHNPTAKNQSARIYKTEIVKTNEKTSYGEPKIILKAKAYMTRSEKNKDMILDIEAGIIKEVSVSCSVQNKVCSVCKSEFDGSCGHKKGQEYNGQLCYVELLSPMDAYEWSFVAIPAQRGAGVTKKFINTNNYNETKNLNENSYIRSLRKEVVKLAFLSNFMKNNKSFETIIEKMDIKELEAFKNEFSIKVSKSAPYLQLGCSHYNYEKDKKKNEDFKI